MQSLLVNNSLVHIPDPGHILPNATEDILDHMPNFEEVKPHFLGMPKFLHDVMRRNAMVQTSRKIWRTLGS